MQRRLDRPMYVPPGRRNRSIVVPDMIIDENIGSDDSDKILNILDFFINLKSAGMKEFGSHLIDFSLILIQKQSYKKDVMEKLAVTLNLVGPSLDQSHSQQLDSLLFVIRDKVIEQNTPPETRRYLLSVIEHRAKKWSIRNV